MSLPFDGAIRACFQTAAPEHICKAILAADDDSILEHAPPCAARTKVMNARAAILSVEKAFDRTIDIISILRGDLDPSGKGKDMTATGKIDIVISGREDLWVNAARRPHADG